MILIPQRKPLWLPRRNRPRAQPRRRMPRWLSMATLWEQGGVLIEDGAGTLLECDDCACDECVANWCSHCCTEPPDELLLTVPAGTYTDNCSAGDCSAAEGQFVMTKSGTACVWNHSSGCGIQVCSPSLAIKYQVSISGAGVKVFAAFTFVPGCGTHYLVFFDGTLPALGGLLDCSFASEVSCTFTSEQHQGAPPALCEADAGDAVTLIAN